VVLAQLLAAVGSSTTPRLLMLAQTSSALLVGVRAAPIVVVVHPTTAAQGAQLQPVNVHLLVVVGTSMAPQLLMLPQTSMELLVRV
jgi:hypothetical protein